MQKLDLSVNPYPPKDAYTFFFFRTILVLGIFLRLPLILRHWNKFTEFPSSRPFFKVVCYFLFKREVETGHSFFNCTGFSKRSSLSHPIYHLG